MKRLILAAVAAVALVAPASAVAVESTPMVVYSAHVQSIGWTADAEDGETAGSTGSGLRVEALKLAHSGGDYRMLSWRGHVQSIGWQAWRDTPSTIGTTGQALRLEAFEIKLKDPAAANEWKIEYRAHVQSIGWQGWVSDGDTAGTVGLAKRIEAVQIRMVPRVASTELAFTADTGLETTGKAVLAKIGSRAPDVTNIVGDLAYQPGAVATFCDQVNTRIATDVQIIAGNHEEDGSEDGEIGEYAACLPDDVGVTGTYAFENYYDQAGVRVVSISPDIPVDGVLHTFASGTPEREWLKATVRDAKAAGLWTVVAMHHPCFSIGLHGCADTTAEVSNLAIGLGVDLVVTGHDHNYSRTHQIRGTKAAPVLIDSDNDYIAQTESTKGSVFAVVGNGGHNPRSIGTKPSYYAYANGTNSPEGFGYGYVEVNATPTQLSYRHISASGATIVDAFTINRGAAVAAMTASPTKLAAIRR